MHLGVVTPVGRDNRPPTNMGWFKNREGGGEEWGRERVRERERESKGEGEGEREGEGEKERQEEVERK